MWCGISEKHSPPAPASNRNQQSNAMQCDAKEEWNQFTKDRKINLIFRKIQHPKFFLPIWESMFNKAQVTNFESWKLLWLINQDHSINIIIYQPSGAMPVAWCVFAFQNESIRQASCECTLRQTDESMFAILVFFSLFFAFLFNSIFACTSIIIKSREWSNQFSFDRFLSRPKDWLKNFA